MQHVLRLIRQTTSEIPRLIVTILFSLLNGGMAVLQAYWMAFIVNAVFLKNQSRNDLTTPFLALLLVIVIRGLSQAGSDISAQELAIRIKNRLRAALITRLGHVGIPYLKEQRPGELIATLVQAIEALEAFFGQYLPQLILAITLPLILLMTVFPLDLITALVFLVTAPLIPLFMSLIGRMAETVTRRQWQALQRMSDFILDTLQGLTSLKAMGRTEERGTRLFKATDAYYRTTLDVLRITFLSALVMELLSTLSTALVAVEIGLRVLYGKLDFQAAFFILLIAPDFYLPLRMLSQRFHAAIGGITASQKIFAILETIPPRSLPQPANSPQSFAIGSSRPVHRLSAPQRIRFEDVTFQYPNRQEPALAGITFELQAGQKIALVGPSGAGKTTLAYLMLGLLQPTQGRILIDGIPREEISPEIWQQWVAWVPQKPYLFNNTVAWNVALGFPEAPSDLIRRACRDAHLEDALERWPHGLETPTGERGLRLSGGEAQRLALARAFVKDAPIIVMDEPTAYLDPILEIQLEQSINRLLAGRSALIIAHRLNTARNASLILVLDQGKIVERGRHEELLSMKGLYAQLWQALER